MLEVDKKELSILYVEDDEDTREELTLFLRQKCENVYVAQDGEEGLRAYKNFLPTLIISDIQMPKMSGIDMALEIRKQNEYVPIIFLTAFNEVNYLKASISLGTLDYSTKPVDLQHLSGKIDEVLTPEKVYVSKCILNKELKLVSVDGNLSKILANSSKIINQPFESCIIDSQIQKFTTLMMRLRGGEKFYRELLSAKGSDGNIVELLVDGEQLNDGRYELTITIMRYFLRSYEKIERILMKEKAINKILEYKNAIFELMVGMKNSSDFLDTICDHIVHFKNYNLAMFYALDKDKKGFELASFSSSVDLHQNDLICKFFLDEKKACCLEEIADKNPVFISGSKIDECPFFDDTLLGKFTKNIVVIPLFLNKKAPITGIFVIMGDEEFLFDIHDIGMLRDIGRTIALGVERIDDKGRLKELLDKANQQSRTDVLTGAYNRLMFDEVLERSLLQSERYGSPLSILYLDLDHFKSVNDRFGHKEGDRVLVRFVKMVLKIVRSADLFARIGGEEFALILPRTDLEKAKEVSEKILNALRAKSLLSNGDMLTTSIGVATYDFEQKKGSDHLLEQVDAKLYEAKHTGRNKMCY